MEDLASGKLRLVFRKAFPGETFEKLSFDTKVPRSGVPDDKLRQNVKTAFRLFVCCGYVQTGGGGWKEGPRIVIVPVGKETEKEVLGL